MEEEEGLGVRRHVDVVLKVSEERAVHHRLGVVLRRQFVTLQKLGDFQNLFFKIVPLRLQYFAVDSEIK